jgi:5-formyltetrahydrofolate cyclo-ligase
MNFEKETLRRDLRSKRANLPKEEVHEKSRKILERLFELPEFKGAKTIAFYISKNGSGEVETEEMIKESLQREKRVLVPIVDQVKGELVFSELQDYDSELEPGCFGILEPKLNCRRVVPLGKADLILVPGIAFDLSGHRVGYGKGYYDKLFKKLEPKTELTGLAYDFQIFVKFTWGDRGLRVHKIVTDEKVVNCKPSD